MYVKHREGKKRKKENMSIDHDMVGVFGLKETD
jgi:hypothetical protein